MLKVGDKVRIHKNASKIFKFLYPFNWVKELNRQNGKLGVIVQKGKYNNVWFYCVKTNGEKEWYWPEIVLTKIKESNRENK